MRIGSGYTSILIRNEQEPNGGRFAPKEPLLKGGGKRTYDPKVWARQGNMQFPEALGNRRRLYQLGKDLKWGIKQARKCHMTVDQLMYLYEQGVGR